MRVHGADYPISHATLADPARQEKPSTRPWRLGFVQPSTWSGAHDYAKDAIAALLERWQAAGIEVVPFVAPRAIDAAHELHATIYEKTLAYYFAEESKKHQLISPVLNGMIERGARITLDQYREAIDKQDDVARAMDDSFVDVDALVTLSVAGEAPLRDEDERQDSCLVWTLARLPVIGAPAMTGPTGLPIGIQLIGRRYNDYRLLSLVEHLAKAGLLPAAVKPVSA
jgi:Asp-tRNA(Asn)/Glu-tRNA(Gln) amidotransferase A subunit family amidase